MDFVLTDLGDSPPSSIPESDELRSAASGRGGTFVRRLARASVEGREQFNDPRRPYSCFDLVGRYSASTPRSAALRGSGLQAGHLGRCSGPFIGLQWPRIQIAEKTLNRDAEGSASRGELAFMTI